MASPTRRTLTRRSVAWAALAAAVLAGTLVGVAWRATSVLWFLLFPLLLVGALAAAAVVVLWAVRHV